MAVVFVLLLLNDTVIIEILQLNCYNSKCKVICQEMLDSYILLLVLLGVYIQ
jgi:hypothetical protein